MPIFIIRWQWKAEAAIAIEAKNFGQAHSKALDRGIPWDGPAIEIDEDNTRIELVDSKCDNCGRYFDQCELADIQDLDQRLSPGGEVPVGECPYCHALCYLFDDKKEAALLGEKPPCRKRRKSHTSSCVSGRATTASTNSKKKRRRKASRAG